MSKDQMSLFDLMGEPSENGTVIEENEDILFTPSEGEEGQADEKPTSSKKVKSGEKPADKTRIVCIYGKSHTYEDRNMTLDDIRKDLQKRYYPELSKDRTEMEYQEKTGLIFPRIKAAKKGQGRKHFLSTKDMAENQAQVVNFLAARDGLYEVRKNEIGVFSAKTKYVHDLDPWQEGFKMFLPKIPFSLLSQAVAFLKRVTEESMVQFFWNRDQKQYFIHCPEQRVTETSIDVVRDGPEGWHLLVMDLHSHNVGEAYYSPADNEDELATQLYGVVGRTDLFFPELRVRISVGGNFCEIDPATVFENPFEDFPADWLYKLTVVEPKGAEEGCCDYD